MKKIEATIRKLKFKDVKVGLLNEGFDTFNYWSSRSVGEGSERVAYKAEADDAVASERVNLNLTVRDDDVQKAVDIIVNSGQTFEVDDARINIFNVNKTLVIRGGEKGDRKFEII